MSEQQQQNMTDITISLSGDWAQDESLISLLTQNPYFTDASVSKLYKLITIHSQERSFCFNRE